jgi:hypothetical protein
MIKIPEDIIEEIAGELEIGAICYYHIKTGELKSLPDPHRFDNIEDELWEEDSNEINENIDDYIEFENITTRMSFEMMSEFASTVKDKSFQSHLFNELQKSKPFSKFKNAIDNSVTYRNKWFEFKEQKFIEWVEKQLEQYNLSEDR